MRTTPLSLRVVLDAWRAITVRMIGVTFLLGVALFAYHFTLYVGQAQFQLDATELWLRVFMTRQISVFSMMLCVVVADRVTGEDSRQRATYAWAIVLGAAAASLLTALASDLLWNSFAWEFGGTTWSSDFRQITYRLEMTIYNFLELLVLGGAAVLVYTDRRHARVTLAWMRAAELDRVRTAKRMLESRLQAMQARVEPPFLFNTLAQVKELYERDVALAERVLDELIAYLRAAMPRMRDTASTVGQEIELVRAYLAIVRIRTLDRFEFAIELTPEAVDARLPPMTLFSLVDLLIVQRLDPERPETALARIAIVVDGGYLKISVACKAVVDDEVVAGVRERLAVLYGDRAAITLRPLRDGGTEALLEIPCEHGLSAADASTAPVLATAGMDRSSSLALVPKG